MLHRKLRRDLWHYRGQLVAVTLMMAAGIAVFVSLRSMKGYLQTAMDGYYARNRFADVFATVTRAPASLIPRISAIPGVARAEGRVVADVTVIVPGNPDLVIGRLVSIPARSDAMLNRIHLTEGRLPGEDEGGAVVVSGTFAAANRLEVGDTLSAIVNGRRDRLTVVGVGYSPEYIYEIRGGAGAVLPDNRRFGVMWVAHRPLAAAFDLTAAFNDLVVQLDRGARSRAVIAELDRLTARYGGLGAIDRNDQVSHQFVSSEIDETQVTSILLPTIFLAVVAFMLYLVTGRLVAIEREQIGLLKAFGFPNRAILVHYALFTAVPIGIGTVVGSGLGIWFAFGLARIYARFYRFPATGFEPDPGLLLATLAIAAAAVVVGGMAAVRAALRLPPAEAMRPPTPARFRAGWFDRIGASRRLSGTGRMIWRAVAHRPVKTALAVTGVAAGYALVVTAWYGFDAIELIKTIAFREASRADYQVGFVADRNGSVLGEIGRIPGVDQVEPIRVVPVRISLGHRSERIGLTGLAATAELQRLVEPTGRTVAIPSDGLILGGHLARKLDAGRGSLVVVDVLVGDRRRLELPVAATVDELMGSGGYLELERLHQLLGEGDVVNGALLAVQSGAIGGLAEHLRRLPAVAGVVDRGAILEAFDRTIAESFRISLVTIFAFACLIAAAVVYNSGRIALSERARDLASLRVLGFTKAEVARMLLGEQAVITLLALPAGAALGFGLCYLMTVRFASDLFRLPFLANPRTYFLAAAFVSGAAAFTALLVRGRVDRLDLVAVLKARE